MLTYKYRWHFFRACFMMAFLWWRFYDGIIKWRFQRNIKTLSRLPANAFFMGGADFSWLIALELDCDLLTLSISLPDPPLWLPEPPLWLLDPLPRLPDPALWLPDLLPGLPDPPDPLPGLANPTLDLLGILLLSSGSRVDGEGLPNLLEWYLGDLEKWFYSYKWKQKIPLQLTDNFENNHICKNLDIWLNKLNF